MKLKTYSDFLLESILYTSDEFKTVLSSMSDSTAKELLSLIDKDIKTNYNILKTTDANDTVSFIPDNQATTKLKSINLSALFLTKANTTSIGRISRSILSDNGITKTDKEMENFVNGFKAAFDKINTKEESIRIVSGEDIRYWYFEERYCDATRRNRGTLGKSCMRYEEAQDYLNIYVKNPDVCKLVIQVDDDNKLVSRALLWETIDNKLFLDRIYYTNDSDGQLLSSWIREKFKDRDVVPFSYRGNFEIQLVAIPEYSQYPYMDSFTYFYAGEYKLYNYEPNKNIDRKKLFHLQETDGTAERQDKRFCEYIDESWPEDECVWSERLNSYLPEHMTVWSVYSNSYLYADNVIKSTIINDYLDNRDAIQVYIDSDERKSVWYPNDGKYKDAYGEDEITGYYYVKDLLIEHNHAYYLRSRAIFVYSVLEESEADYEKIYHTKYYTCSELDAKVFGFKLTEDSDVESKNNYYKNVYRNVKYKEFMEKLNSLEVDKEYIDLKIAELNEADSALRRGTDFYKVNNILYEKFNSDPVKIMEEYRKIVESEFDEIFEFLRNRIGWPDVIKYKDEVKYFSLNPIVNEKYLSNLNRNELTSIKEKILEKNKDMDTREVDQIAFSIVGTCERIIQRVLHTDNGHVIYYYLTRPSQFKQ